MYHERRDDVVPELRAREVRRRVEQQLADHDDDDLRERVHAHGDHAAAAVRDAVEHLRRRASGRAPRELQPHNRAQ